LASMKSYASLGIQARTVEELQLALVEKFVAQQLNTTVKTEFPAEKSRKWLGFMAKKMEENGAVVFELVDLNLAWLDRKWVYYLLGFLWIAWFGIPAIIVEVEMLALVLAVIGLLWLTTSSSSFKKDRIVAWSLKTLSSQIKNILLVLCVYIVYSTLIAFIKLFYEIDLMNNKSSAYLLVFFVIILLFYLFRRSSSYTFLFCILLSLSELNSLPRWGVWLVLFIMTIYVNGLTWKSHQQSERLHTPLIISLWRWVMTHIVIGILWFTVDKEEDYLISIPGTILSTLILLPFFLIGKHLLIRITVALERKLPFQFPTFLREMDARHIFESPGGSWRFRHKILQDYFIQEYERMEREQLLPKSS
jgi:hypothetical protein